MKLNEEALDSITKMAEAAGIESGMSIDLACVAPGVARDLLEQVRMAIELSRAVSVLNEKVDTLNAHVLAVQERLAVVRAINEKLQITAHQRGCDLEDVRAKLEAVTKELNDARKDMQREWIAGYGEGSADKEKTMRLSFRLRKDWREEDGDVLWWVLPVCEAPYCGSPLDVEWPGHHTHWSNLPPTEEIAAAEREAGVANVCGKQCVHGSECLLLEGHEPADRHETQHGCIFYDR